MPRLWPEKVDFIERYGGIALVNPHPDYLSDRATSEVYTAFLRDRSGYWNAMPQAVALWCRARTDAPSIDALPGATEGFLSLADRTVAPSADAAAGLRYAPCLLKK